MLARFNETIALTRGHPALYVLRIWPLVTLPTLAIAALLAASPFAPPPESSPLAGLPSDLRFFALMVVVTPVLETLLMGALLWLPIRLGAPALLAALGSALLWGFLHAAPALFGPSTPLWGVTIFWAFFVLSLAYIHWARARSHFHALGVATGLHALNNAVPATLMLAWAG